MTDQQRALIAPFAERFNLAVEHEAKANRILADAQRTAEEAVRLKRDRLMDLRRVIGMIEPDILKDDGGVDFDTYALRVVRNDISSG